jgi:hypothetical protein
MRYTKTLGLALVAALALSGVAAASASAAFEWKLNGVRVTESVPVKMEGSIQLVDKKGGLPGGSDQVTCSVSNKGTVGTEGKGTITESSLTHCVGGGICMGETKPVAKAYHLPWATKPYKNPEEKAVSELRGTAGSPGWEWECHSAFGTIVDKCTTQAGWTLLTNTSELGVGIVAEQSGGGPLPTILDCTRGGESGEMRVEDHIKAVSGGSLEVT